MGAFPFRECGYRFIGERNCWYSICLRAKFRVMVRGPRIDRGEVVVADEVGKSLAPVVADGFGLGGSACGELG